MSLKGQRWLELLIENWLRLSAVVTIGTTIAILYVLFAESLVFFKDVSLWEFLTDTQWTPLFAQKHFGILPLLSGTVLTTTIAIAVALPVGLLTAIFLSEYASTRVRSIVKPVLEILSAIPTVVYGYFALVFVTPALQTIIPSLAGFNALSPGIVMGVMIIPFISSLSEDALRAVPQALREAAYGMGATRPQTIGRVLIPAASSGIIAAVVLALARAVGETMIVAIAAGQQPRLTLNPLVPIETITTYIVQVSLGDVPHGSIEYRTIFAAGMMLFVFTLVFNIFSFYINRRFRQQYE